MFDSTFESIYLAGTIVAGAIRIKYTRGRSRDDIVVDRRTRIDVLVVTLTGMGVILPLLYFSTPWFDFADYHLPPWAAWLGVLAFALSLWLLWRSHAELGRHWSNYARIKQDHTLVKSGVYRCIRHPMYSAHWHWAVAQALLIWNWLAGFGMLLAYIPIYMHRVPREERMLIEHFGDEYRRYMKRTGRVLPKAFKKKQ